LTLVLSETEQGDYCWRLYVAMSQEPGRGTLAEQSKAFHSATEAAVDGMKGIESYSVKQWMAPVDALGSRAR
jgi:hypothetical protein